MSKYRMSARIDKNQNGIVEALRKIPGVTVEVGHDDILIGHQGLTLWFEIKDTDCIGKNGKIRESSKKDSQKKLESTWKGHYRIVTSIEEILEDINSPCNKCKPDCRCCKIRIDTESGL